LTKKTELIVCSIEKIDFLCVVLTKISIDYFSTMLLLNQE